MTTRIIVTGTDTGIGKTVFAAGLTRLLDGYYFKPVQAGLEKETDTATMTFVVMETRWTDAKRGDPVVTERFNLIARMRK